jgi:predicted ATPase
VKSMPPPHPWGLPLEESVTVSSSTKVRLVTVPPPFVPVAQTFKTLVCQILSKNETEVERWRDAIRDAVGLNGQLVVNLIPELVIGKQAPVTELLPQGAQNRFQAVLRAFLGIFARKGAPARPLPR